MADGQPVASAAIPVISAMLTPALLILASSSLAGTTLVRLGRAVDRARVLVELRRHEPGRTDIDPALHRYRLRTADLELAMIFYFIAIATFILASLTIAVDQAAGGAVSWLPIALTIVGMLLMLAGAASMLRESRLAMQGVRDELAGG